MRHAISYGVDLGVGCRQCLRMEVYDPDAVARYLRRHSLSFAFEVFLGLLRCPCGAGDLRIQGVMRTRRPTVIEPNLSPLYVVDAGPKRKALDAARARLAEAMKETGRWAEEDQLRARRDLARARRALQETLYQGGDF